MGNGKRLPVKLPTKPQPKPAPSSIIKNLLAKHKKHRPTPKRIYVIDTNVLMHDPASLISFQEHDVVIPFPVLEELDKHKKGHEDINRNARESSRKLDEIFSQDGAVYSYPGTSLSTVSNGKATGNIFFHGKEIGKDDIPDNLIIQVAKDLKEKNQKMEVVIVSNDINMRIKAKALGILSEDYKTDKVVGDDEFMPTGIITVPPDFLDQLKSSFVKEGETHYVLPRNEATKGLKINTFIAKTQEGLRLKVRERSSSKVVLTLVKDFFHTKNSVWGIVAKNEEQNFALNLLMDPNVDLVVLTGKAGSGKTLMTLASALNQALERGLFSEIIYTRATIPVGEDIGFLPGTEEDKLTPWMGALEDNLDVLIGGDHKDDKHGAVPKGADWNRAATYDLIKSRLKIKALNFMRGRTFLNKFLIIDEAQNLTPKQMKTLITRAGPGTKVVCLGNTAQIDTPYLNERSCGLTYLVEKFMGWPHFGHIMLQGGERSRLANHANDVL